MAVNEVAATATGNLVPDEIDQVADQDVKGLEASVRSGHARRSAVAAMVYANNLVPALGEEAGHVVIAAKVFAETVNQ